METYAEGDVSKAHLDVAIHGGAAWRVAHDPRGLAPTPVVCEATGGRSGAGARRSGGVVHGDAGGDPLQCGDPRALYATAGVGKAFKVATVQTPDDPQRDDESEALAAHRPLSIAMEGGRG